ncbi:uncharacterized protein LOC141651211 [Silene latifolia]|uniref:uncharacterized protein LOC141651211 n=1 Tax=Silene latifolia TaxID=37657 RepID=UPI003D784C50
MTVADLLKPQGRGWDKEIVECMFLPSEATRILNIRTSPNLPRDEWYWSLDRDGEYTVKMADACLVGDLNDTGGPSNWERRRWLWNRLWKVWVWPRIKLFFWQLCSGALATLDNIAARVRDESSSCYFCTSSSESSLHLFRDCSVAKWVWSSLNLDGAEEGDMMDGVGEVRDWVEEIWRAGDARDVEKYMVGCWAIWEHRNKVAFDGAMIEPDRIASRVRDILSELETGGEGGQGCQNKRKGKTEERGNDGWKTAMNGYVKINVDAGVKEGEGVSTGVVYRDERGEVLWGMTIVRSAEWDPRVAEAAAVYDGLQEAQIRGHRDVVVESD